MPSLSLTPKFLHRYTFDSTICPPNYYASAQYTINVTIQNEIMTESMPFQPTMVPSFRIESTGTVHGHHVYKAMWSLHQRRAAGSIKVMRGPH